MMRREKAKDAPNIVIGTSLSKLNLLMSCLTIVLCILPFLSSWLRY